jgi:hypothetical protein
MPKQRLKRGLSIVATSAIVAVFSLGASLPANADEVAPSDETVSTTEVVTPTPEVAVEIEAPAVVEDTTPPEDTTTVAPVVEEVAPEPEEAPVVDTPADSTTDTQPAQDLVTVGPVVEEVAPAPPAEPLTKPDPYTEPVTTLKEVTPDLDIECERDEGEVGYQFKYGASGAGTEGIVYSSTEDSETLDAYVTATPLAGYTLVLNSSLWVLNNDGSATVNATLLGDERCSTPPPTCVEDVNWAYTFDPTTTSGAITVTAANEGEQGTKLCDPLAVRPTKYEYDRPASGSPSWPQTNRGYNDVLVSSIGTFPYSAPVIDKCWQGDVYAEFVSNGGFDALKVPDKLLGPNNPYEPQFLHQALPGAGPNPTYGHTSSEGCNTPPVTPEPKVKYTEWQDAKWVCGDTSVTQTRTKTTTPSKVVLQDGQWTIVEDTDNITTVTETQTRELTPAEIESCKPTPTPTVTPTPTPTPVNTIIPVPTPTATTVAMVSQNPPSVKSLAATGFELMAVAGGALALIVAGAFLVVRRHRRTAVSVLEQ